MSNWVDMPMYWPSNVDEKAYDALEWAKKNCPSYITNDTVKKEGNWYYRFFFGQEKDVMIFMLRWT